LERAASGRLFARQLAKAVYDVVISNDRGPDCLASLLRDLGPGIADYSAPKAAVAAYTRG
jgi:predicted dinucleotide-binding enzyme